MKYTYLVTLVDRDNGQTQRIVVRAENEESIVPYLETNPAPVRGEGIKLANPYVVNIRKLNVKHPVKTVFSEFAENACS